MLAAGLQKFTAAYRLSRETSETHFFGLKIRKMDEISVNHLTRWKQVENAVHNNC